MPVHFILEKMTDHNSRKIAIPICFRKWIEAGYHFRKKRESNEMIIETIIMVVMGMYIFRLGRSIIISPGRRPMGSLPSQGQKSPTARNITPKPISTFCITNYQFSSSANSYPLESSCSRPLTIFPSASLPKCFIMLPMACIGLL